MSCPLAIICVPTSRLISPACSRPSNRSMSCRPRTVSRSMRPIRASGNSSTSFSSPCCDPTPEEIKVLTSRTPDKLWAPPAESAQYPTLQPRPHRRHAIAIFGPRPCGTSWQSRSSHTPPSPRSFGRSPCNAVPPTVQQQDHLLPALERRTHLLHPAHARKSPPCPRRLKLRPHVHQLDRRQRPAHATRCFSLQQPVPSHASAFAQLSSEGVADPSTTVTPASLARITATSRPW